MPCWSMFYKGEGGTKLNGPYTKEIIEIRYFTLHKNSVYVTTTPRNILVISRYSVTS